MDLTGINFTNVPVTSGLTPTDYNEVIKQWCYQQRFWLAYSSVPLLFVSLGALITYQMISNFSDDTIIYQFRNKKFTLLELKYDLLIVARWGLILFLVMWILRDVYHVTWLPRWL